jgi:selenide,water dikinase
VASNIGIALLGHAQEMAEHSAVLLRIHADEVPLLPGAMDYANRWLFRGGSKRNRGYCEQWIAVDSGVPQELLMLMYTPETSGGLLIAVPADRLESVEAYMREQGQSHWAVGEGLSERGISIA